MRSHRNALIVHQERMRKKEHQVVHHAHRHVKVIASKQQDYVKDVPLDMDIQVANVLFVHLGNILKEERVHVQRVQQENIHHQVDHRVVWHVQLANILLLVLRVALIVQMENTHRQQDQRVV